MIVVDTNILAYLTLPYADPSLGALAGKVLKPGTALVLPSLWRHKLLNVLAKMVKAGALDLETAESAWARCVSLAGESEAPVDMIRALRLTKELGISAYDAQFLALAEAANTVLVTEDKRLRQAAGSRAMSMEQYLAA